MCVCVCLHSQETFFRSPTFISSWISCTRTSGGLFMCVYLSKRMWLGVKDVCACVHVFNRWWNITFDDHRDDRLVCFNLELRPQSEFVLNCGWNHLCSDGQVSSASSSSCLLQVRDSFFDFQPVCFSHSKNFNLRWHRVWCSTRERTSSKGVTHIIWSLLRPSILLARLVTLSHLKTHKRNRIKSKSQFF